MLIIESSAFAYCSSLTSIEIPEGVTTIKPSTFYGCNSLESIIIPEGVTSIGHQAFLGCENLTIYCKCEASNKPTGWEKWWEEDIKKTYFKNQWEYVNGVPTPIRKK